MCNLIVVQQLKHNFAQAQQTPLPGQGGIPRYERRGMSMNILMN